MKTYYYNLDAQQALHFASLEKDKDKDKEMVIVVPLLKQPPEGFELLPGSLYSDFVEYVHFRNIETGEHWKGKFPYPFNARVGLRETWDKILYYDTVNGKPYKHYKYAYKAAKDLSQNQWRSAQCMPRDAINQRGNWGIVEDVRVGRVQDV